MAKAALLVLLSVESSAAFSLTARNRPVLDKASSLCHTQILPSYDVTSSRGRLSYFQTSTRATASDRATGNDTSTPSLNPDNDSIERYAQDLATVLTILRANPKDTTIPKPFADSPRSFSNTWSFQDWDVHLSRARYLRYIVSFPVCSLIRQCAPQLAVLMTWSAIACWSFQRNGLDRLVLPLTPLSLVSTFVAALLTLRSNQGLDRLNQGRLAFGQVVLYTRDMAQMISATIYPKDPYLALKLLRHVALFGWLLRGFLRGDVVNGSDEDLIRTMLNDADATYVLQQRKKPVAVVTRLRQVIAALHGKLNTAEELALDHTTQNLNHCIMTTERIRASPIPPLYTAHTSRLLIFYLFFLPLALKGSGLMNVAGTMMTTFAVGYVARARV
jgi:predicted membrane chloride channel (bestrophin family)